MYMSIYYGDQIYCFWEMCPIALTKMGCQQCHFILKLCENFIWYSHFVSGTWVTVMYWWLSCALHYGVKITQSHALHCRFLNDPFSIVWSYFLDRWLTVCYNIIKNRKWQCAEELNILGDKMKNARDENFHTSNLISLLSDFEDFYRNEQFTKLAHFSCNIFLLYLEKLNKTSLPWKVFHWTLIKSSPIWE
jgi:hypothetical protein